MPSPASLATGTWPPPYIHLSGCDLAAKFTTSMAHVHAWRRAALADLVGGQP